MESVERVHKEYLRYLQQALELDLDPRFQPGKWGGPGRIRFHRRQIPQFRVICVATGLLIPGLEKWSLDPCIVLFHSSGRRP